MKTKKEVEVANATPVELNEEDIEQVSGGKEEVDHSATDDTITNIIVPPVFPVDEK